MEQNVLTGSYNRSRNNYKALIFLRIGSNEDAIMLQLFLKYKYLDIKAHCQLPEK